MNEWTTFTLVILGVWMVIYLARKDVRREMFLASVYTAPIGLLEPLFVPAYWNPPSLFDLSAKTGFDIESIIFCFSIGGIASVLYEVFFRVRHVKIRGIRNRLHLFAILVPVLLFAALFLTTKLNPIYIASIAMFSGGVLAMLSRPDLRKKITVGGMLFLALYFIYFLAFDMVYPEAVERIWNLKAISGILFFGVPIEELMNAFTFGMMWSSAYEYVMGYRIKEVSPGMII